MDITTDHTLEQIIICGGLWSDSNIRKTCLTLNTTGDWENFSQLLHQRPYHSSWASPSGKPQGWPHSTLEPRLGVLGVRLLGGDESSRVT